MDPITIAMICIIIGAIFIFVEAVSPGAFLLVPGGIFIVIGVIGYFVDGFFESWQLPVTVVLVTVVMTLLTIKLYHFLAKPAPPETVVVESLIGREGQVLVAVMPNSLKGKVRIGSDTWSATSETPITEGVHVTVYAAEGVHVKVRPK
jgi:membrane protein implicated in regulation of membrane protease activity